jgi:predicted ester cyclase
MSNAQNNKAIVRRWNEEFWGKNYNLEIVDELAASYMLFNHSLHTPRVGREPIKAFMAGFRAAFPDLRFESSADLIADGDVVVSRWIGVGTHTGPAFYDLRMGALPKASGRKMRFTGMSVFRFEGGKIVEETGLDDGVTALQQLGFIRTPVWPA